MRRDSDTCKMNRNERAGATTMIMLLLARLLGTSLVLTSNTAFADQGAGDPPSLLEFVRIKTLGFVGAKHEIQQTQPNLVIGAGLPQTGTSSLVVALNKQAWSQDLLLSR